MFTMAEQLWTHKKDKANEKLENSMARQSENASAGMPLSTHAQRDGQVINTMLPLPSYGPTHTHTRLMALFRDYPGEPVPER